MSSLLATVHGRFPRSNRVGSISMHGCDRFVGSSTVAVRSRDANRESNRLSLSYGIFRLIAFSLAGTVSIGASREPRAERTLFRVELSNYLEGNLCLQVGRSRNGRLNIGTVFLIRNFNSCQRLCVKYFELNIDQMFLQRNDNREKQTEKEKRSTYGLTVAFS